ncbi:MAG: dihydroorotase [Acidimicrobiia bacterium]
MILIESGKVLTISGWRHADVLIESGKVKEVGRGLRAETVVDASGCLVGPGLVDIHTHVREPGETWKEDVSSASMAAVRGGYTAMVTMPNTVPPADSPKVTGLVQEIGRRVGLVDVIPAGTLTVGRAGATASDIEAMYESGVRMFTDDGDSVGDTETLRGIMLRVAALPGAIVAQHAEDVSMTAGGHMHEGELSRRLGIGGLPAEAETSVVERDLRLVRETGASYHCQHVSSKMTVDLIRDAKAEGLPVTAEVTPHHLSFDVSELDALDTNFKMYPPLRTDQDRAALVAALRDGTIDVVATDHAPHGADEKSHPFTDAPRGVIGLETAASAVWAALGDDTRLFEVMSINPARTMGLGSQGLPIAPGNPANLVVFDPAAEWVADEFVSKSANSPFLGSTMKGRVVATIHHGDLVLRVSERS